MRDSSMRRGQRQGRAVMRLFGFGVRGHDRALELADMSASQKAVPCRRTPKYFEARSTLIHDDCDMNDRFLLPPPQPVAISPHRNSQFWCRICSISRLERITMGVVPHK